MWSIPIVSIIDHPTKIVGVRGNVKEWKIQKKMMTMIMLVEEERRVPPDNHLG